jgi:2,4-dienoyl-CoA reductase-like NADH-dependent reductase (Old Yellow Enzyme family)/thioredoxin reductase
MSEMGPHLTQVKYKMAIPDKRHIPFLQKLTDEVHENGGMIFQMIHAMGSQAGPFYTRAALWAPSPIPGVTMEVPHEMDHDDIREIINGFRLVASVLRDAGYDGIVLEGGGTFLIGSFFSPWSNKRTDEYGGSVKNRVRLGIEVAEAVRKVIGTDMVLGMAFPIDEVSPYEAGALTLEQGCEIGRILDESGLFDLLECRIGSYKMLFSHWAPDSFTPRCYGAYASKEFKKIAKNAKVATVGRIRLPSEAERLLTEGAADLIGLGRPLWVDHEWPNKAREGREDEIIHCISQLTCLDAVRSGRFPVKCSVNPVLGRERELGIGKIPIAAKRKRVVIVGGGPAGLKCAEISAKRSHEVILLEKGKELGGAVHTAAKVPGLEELQWAIEPLINIIQKLNVDIRLNTTATIDMVLNLSPDAVVVSTGATSFVVPIEKSAMDVYTAEQILDETIKTGERVVVYDDNMAVGSEHWRYCGIGLFLAKKGRQITMVTPKMFVGAGLPAVRQTNLLAQYSPYKVKMIARAQFLRLESKKVVVKDIYTGEETICSADTLVWVANRVANDTLFHELKGKISELYEIGDALAPRRIESAIYEGFELGRKL